MKFGFMTVADHQKAMKAKDDRIAALEAKLSENEGEDRSETLAAIEKLFGEEAKEEGFDLEAKVKATLDYAAGLEKDLSTAKGELTSKETELKAANEQLNGIAKHLGHDSAEGKDLAEEVGNLETEGRKTPLQKEKKELKSKDDDILCDFDEELDQMLKERGIE